MSKDTESPVVVGKKENVADASFIYLYDGNYDESEQNDIAENIYSQVYGDGYNYSMLYEIFLHSKIDDAIPIESRYYNTLIGDKRKVITTKWWQLKVKWDSGKTSYIALKDLKETNPVEIWEYVKANDINK